MLRLLAKQIETVKYTIGTYLYAPTYGTQSAVDYMWPTTMSSCYAVLRKRYACIPAVHIQHYRIGSMGGRDTISHREHEVDLVVIWPEPSTRPAYKVKYPFQLGMESTEGWTVPVPFSRVSALTPYRLTNNSPFPFSFPQPAERRELLHGVVALQTYSSTSACIVVPLPHTDLGT